MVVFQVAKYTVQVNELEDRFRMRSGEFKMIQGELKTIKEFKKMKAHMEHELSSVRMTRWPERILTPALCTEMASVRLQCS